PAAASSTPAWLAGVSPPAPAPPSPTPAWLAGASPAAPAPSSPAPAWTGGGSPAVPRWGRRYWITVAATLLGLLLLGIVLRAIVR
ncbi:MAG: hypothetical protein ACREIU_01205, partial [Planctomycetota bacterium]